MTESRKMNSTSGALRCGAERSFRFPTVAQLALLSSKAKSVERTNAITKRYSTGSKRLQGCSKFVSKCGSWSEWVQTLMAVVSMFLS